MLALIRYNVVIAVDKIHFSHVGAYNRKCYVPHRNILKHVKLAGGVLCIFVFSSARVSVSVISVQHVYFHSF